MIGDLHGSPPRASPPARRCLGSPTAALVVLVFAVTVVRLVLGHVFFGFHTGDDVEILQAGLMRAVGWPHQPWQIRNLFIVDAAAAPAAWLAAAFGVRSMRLLLWVEAWPLAALASVNVVLVWRFALEWLRSRPVALLAAVLYGLHWIPLGYGSMVYPRTASTTCVLLAALLLVRSPLRAWRAAAAGGWIGVAWAIRYSEAIFVLPVAGWLLLEHAAARRRWFLAGAAVAGFSAVSLLTVGVYDWLSWGRPFASLVAFARYTLLERRASSLAAVQPWQWYFWRLPKWLPLTLLPLLWRARVVPQAVRVAGFVVLPLAVLCFIHHKQLRYLQGVLPFALLLAAGGAWSLWRRGRRWWAGTLVALSLVWGLSGITFLSRKSMAAAAMAQRLSAERPAGRELCLSQAWAYGNDLFLGRGVRIRDLPYPMTAAALAGLGERCAYLALYREDVERDVELRRAVEREGFVPWAAQAWGRSKAVVAFRGRAGTPPPR